MKSSERITINCLWPLFSSMCPYAISRFFITELLVPKKLSNKVLFNKGNFSCQTSCSISWKVPCLSFELKHSNLNTWTRTLKLEHSNLNTGATTQRVRQSERQKTGSLLSSTNRKYWQQKVCWLALWCDFFFLYDSRSKVDYIANRLRAIKTTLS